MKLSPLVLLIVLVACGKATPTPATPAPTPATTSPAPAPTPVPTPAKDTPATPAPLVFEPATLTDQHLEVQAPKGWSLVGNAYRSNDPALAGASISYSNICKTPCRAAPAAEWSATLDDKLQVERAGLSDVKVIKDEQRADGRTVIEQHKQSGFAFVKLTWASYTDGGTSFATCAFNAGAAGAKVLEDVMAACAAMKLATP